ncbi:transcription factor PAR2-like [Zingiber officinale]|uniref:Uncharacterized protein n=1 Tax=Zingiber officinale TaxID=94328 RepID=A0A8J5HN06_ZINOF|nr:transcription factor PAR2-like [Zingiber officinale]XP_042455300.1 transcription factor PAR2-like [Zingiber officinale]XP_042455302.1 transcription factor PAR2-like [Zingiber officinale]KAG6529049.1 hypothetical protein ZIOFF_011243 [Zingiber officinale]
MPPAGSIVVASKSTRPVLRMGQRRRKEVPSNSRRPHRRTNAGTKQIRRPPEPDSFSSPEVVAQRLEVLRSLVPRGISRTKEPKMDAAAATAADMLFDETAEYILLLRSQVEALKRMLDAVCMEKNHDDA